jgi:hypothetical protein
MKTQNNTVFAQVSTREHARNLIRKAKALGVQGLTQPVKAYGKWFVEVKPKEVLTLKRSV